MGDDTDPEGDDSTTNDVTSLSEPVDRGEADPSVSDPVAQGEPGPTPREEAALDRVRAVSRLLDTAVRVPGTDFRVGLDPVLGILPGAGDAVAAAISLYPIAEAYRFDVPRRTLAKMLALVALDAGLGSIPLVGPVFDAVFKANKWNLRTLERHLEGR